MRISGNPNSFIWLTPYNAIMAEKTLQKIRARMIGAKVAAVELEKIRNLVEAGAYLNSSDFVRDAIREKLSSIEVIRLRDIDYKTAKKEVLGYYEKFREAYPDEAANELGIGVEMVMRIVGELIKEKRMEVID